MSPLPPYLLLGCGFLGKTFAQHAIAAGHEVFATTRAGHHTEALKQAGITPILAPELTHDALDPRLIARARVLVSFPPDGHTDARMAPHLAGAAAIAYVSSTAVYGQVRGTVDHATAPQPADQRGHRRLSAEAEWQHVGACVLRAPAIYGPGRGIHKRLRVGGYQLPGSGLQHVSRIHVEDLAALCAAALTRGNPGHIYLVGDLAPCTHHEVVAWLCERLQLPMPPEGPLQQAARTLQGDRQVDPRHALATLGVPLRYEDYRSGYAAVLDHESR